jgi:CRP/FNR family cyclic AMP-dependent transcriptional regulator
MITMTGLLAEQPFFAGMRPIHLERLSSYARRSVLRTGAKIFTEGGTASRFWIIREGLVEISTHLPARRDAVIETLGAGSVLGWSWMFPPYAWHFSAVAVEPTLAIEFRARELLRLCDGDAELGYELTKRLMAVLVERLQATRSRLIQVYEP